jgi:hypothetical protein
MTNDDHSADGHALQQIDGETVEFTEFLAYDETGKYAFLLQYKVIPIAPARGKSPSKACSKLPPCIGGRGTTCRLQPQTPSNCEWAKNPTKN